MDFLKDLWITSLAGPCVLWVRKCKIKPCYSQYHATLVYTIIEKNKLQTKQNKALRNRTAPAIHSSVPCFHGAWGLLASIPDCIDHAQLLGFCACAKL